MLTSVVALQIISGLRFLFLHENLQFLFLLGANGRYTHRIEDKIRA